MCGCGCESEITAHFFLCCQNHLIYRLKLLKNVYNLDQTLRNYDDDHLIHILLYDSEKFSFNLNKEIIKLTICYLNVSMEVLLEISIFFLFVIIIIIIIVLLHHYVVF